MNHFEMPDITVYTLLTEAITDLGIMSGGEQPGYGGDDG